MFEIQTLSLPIFETRGTVSLAEVLMIVAMWDHAGKFEDVIKIAEKNNWEKNGIKGGIECLDELVNTFDVKDVLNNRVRIFYACIREWYYCALNSTSKNKPNIDLASSLNIEAIKKNDKYSYNEFRLFFQHSFNNSYENGYTPDIWNNVYWGFSDSIISKAIHISRQSVNKNRKLRDKAIEQNKKEREKEICELQQKNDDYYDAKQKETIIRKLDITPSLMESACTINIDNAMDALFLLPNRCDIMPSRSLCEKSPLGTVKYVAKMKNISCLEATRLMLSTIRNIHNEHEEKIEKEIGIPYGTIKKMRRMYSIFRYDIVKQYILKDCEPVYRELFFPGKEVSKQIPSWQYCKKEELDKFIEKVLGKKESYEKTKCDVSYYDRANQLRKAVRIFWECQRLMFCSCIHTIVDFGRNDRREDRDNIIDMILEDVSDMSADCVDFLSRKMQIELGQVVRLLWTTFGSDLILDRWGYNIINREQRKPDDYYDYTKKFEENTAYLLLTSIGPVVEITSRKLHSNRASGKMQHGLIQKHILLETIRDINNENAKEFVRGAEEGIPNKELVHVALEKTFALVKDAGLGDIKRGIETIYPFVEKVANLLVKNKVIAEDI